QPARVVSGPLGLRTIPVKFDAVAVRIAQIQGLADSVICRSLQLDACADQPAQRIAQRGASGIHQRQMIQPRCSASWGLTVAALPRIQADVVMVSTSR